MKNNTVALSVFIFLFCVFINSINAQTKNQIEDKKWSRILPDNNIVISGKSNYKYISPPKVIRSYFFGENDAVVQPNHRIFPGTNSTQSELSIDIHPLNPSILFASANATNWPFSTIYGTGVYWSTTAGINWSGFNSPPFGTNYGDPSSAIGTNGYFYEGYITLAGGMGVATSTNNGANWTTSVASSMTSDDKNHLMVDKQVGSLYENRLYNTWTDFNGGANDGDIVFKYSTNFGSTWSALTNLSGSLSPGSHAQGCNVQTGPNGEVYVTFAIYDAWPGGEDAIGFAKSTDGGATWIKSRIYNAVNFGIRGDLKPTSIRVSSFPSMSVDRSGGANNGNIYIVWPQINVAPAGTDPDIVVIRSTNNGTTWSSPIRVNNDALNNGKDQYYPWCTVDQSNGQLHVVFYDNRNTTADSSGVFMATSTDGGLTFDNFQVSDANFKPKPISGLASGYQGDYIGIAAADGNAYPFWADDRTGNYQAWITQVTFGPPCPVDPASNPSPLDAAIDVSSYLSQLSWTNGAGANQCEVWFGHAGNMIKVYDGNLISSYSLTASLDYLTLYNWQIVEKNDTCGVSGPIWSFLTEQSPAIVYLEPFTNMDCLTPIGPLGTSNWSIENSTNAGGTAPELVFNWSPQFDGLSKLVSCAIPVENNHNYSINLNHMLDWYATPTPTIGIGVSYDNGTTYTPVWSITPSGDVGPETITASFTTTASASYLYLVLFCNGNSYNIDNWYVDNIILIDDEYSVIVDPTGVLATAINGTQIDIAFTPNINSNNVLVVWNLTGSFSDPSGTPPALGQPFAGGTLLYNGITSPVHHMELNQLTDYYYKLFSYDGVNYSPGVSANASTSYFTDFAVNFLVSDNCANSISLVFGTAPSATECFDAGLDQLAPPPPPAGAFDGRFTSCNLGMFKDFKTTNPDEVRIWDLYYQPAQSCAPVNFSWDPVQLPPDGNFHLVDPYTGTMVNVNMRTTNNFTDDLNLGHLQIIFNYELCSNFNINTGWNMLSLPLIVSDPNYLTLFPNANPGSLFGYSNEYFSSETIGTCNGYWLNFAASETVEVCGSDRTECAINLNTGWNMIGGPNCNIPLGSIGDPGGIIIPGTVYEYSEGYVSATSIDATKAYWVNANAAGSIILSCGTQQAEKTNKLKIPIETLTNFIKIDISDANNKVQTLYFDGKLDENTSLEQFSLPPIPPPGSFDARLTGDFRLSENDEVSIKLQSSNYPISIIVTAPNNNEEYSYVLQEIADGAEVGSHTIVDGVKIVIGNKNSSVLKISKQQALPTSYDLEQNYPNPFNPSTNIKFSLPEAANATLTIYNAIGQKINVLVNTRLDAGRYNYQWNAVSVASGIYIYELRTDKFVAIKKMMLLK